MIWNLPSHYKKSANIINKVQKNEIRSNFMKNMTVWLVYRLRRLVGFEYIFFEDQHLCQVSNFDFHEKKKTENYRLRPVAPLTNT